MSNNTNKRGWSDEPEENEVRIPLTDKTPIELTVENPNGSVLVRSGDDQEVLVLSHKYGRRDSARYEAASLEVSVWDQKIHVAPHFSKISSNLSAIGTMVGAFAGKEINTKINFGSHGNEVAFDLEIVLPRDAAVGTVQVKTASGDATVREIAADVVVSTASGDATVNDVTGAVTVNTASGEIHTQATSGDLKVNTASGDAVIEQPVGPLNVHTASGDARTTGAALPSFGFHTASGDLAIEATLTGDGPYRINGVSGDADLALEPGPEGVTVTFQSVSGDARLPSPFQKTDRRTWQIGQGGPTVNVKTVSGDLHARTLTLPAAPSRRDANDSRPTPATPPTPPTPVTPPTPPAPLTPASPTAVAPDAPTTPIPAPPAPTNNTVTETAESDDDQARLAMLQAVERGELDIEEALRRLDGDESPPQP